MKARTKEAALQNILTELDAGRLGAKGVHSGCVYESEDGKHCSVGCLFTPEQHEWIQSRKLNGVRVQDLAASVGEENLFHMTGMSVKELSVIQRSHDIGFLRNSHTLRFRNMLLKMQRKEAKA